VIQGGRLLSSCEVNLNPLVQDLLAGSCRDWHQLAPSSSNKEKRRSGIRCLLLPFVRDCRNSLRAFQRRACSGRTRIQVNLLDFNSESCYRILRKECVPDHL
jgi:hypothetical protein